MNTLTGHYAYLGFPISLEEENVDSYFAEDKRGFDNLVCHSKLVAAYPGDVAIASCYLRKEQYGYDAYFELPYRDERRDIGENGYAARSMRFRRDSDGNLYRLLVKVGRAQYLEKYKGDVIPGYYPDLTIQIMRQTSDSELTQWDGFRIGLRFDSQGRNGQYSTWNDHSCEFWKSLAIQFDADHADLRQSSWSQDTANRMLDYIMSKYATWIEGLYYFREEEATRVITIPLRNWNTYSPQKVILPTPNESRQAFLFDEPEVFIEQLDPLLLGRDVDFSGYWRNWLTQHAFLDACQNLPRLNDNSISNVIELVSFIYNLVVKHQIEIPKSLGSAWLSYRYQFTTTKLDAEEAIQFVHRHMDLGDLDKGITSYGAAFTTYNGIDVSCRCLVQVTPRELGYLDKIWRGLYTYGLQPNFYVIWDMIPYSFIVDWFIPIGDMASVLDAKRMYSGDYYDFKRICYSLSYDHIIDNKRYHCYTRWPGSMPPELNELYWLDRADASSKTVGYRILDTLSLFVGH
jgi:hypothetical protein